MRIAVFGGSFDPPHFGHTGVARGILKDKMAEKVLFVPAWKAPHKLSNKQAAYQQRLEMLEIMLAQEPGCLISQIEGIEKKEPSYTFDTMQLLSAQYPEDELILLIGSDSLLDLHTWHRARELVKKWKIITYPRPNNPVSYLAVKKNWGFFLRRKLLLSLAGNLDVFNFSSSRIRRKIAQDIAACESMTEKKVLDYIKTKKLYVEE